MQHKRLQALCTKIVNDTVNNSWSTDGVGRPSKPLKILTAYAALWALASSYIYIKKSIRIAVPRTYAGSHMTFKHMSNVMYKYAYNFKNYYPLFALSASVDLST